MRRGHVGLLSLVIACGSKAPVPQEPEPEPEATAEAPSMEAAEPAVDDEPAPPAEGERWTPPPPRVTASAGADLKITYIQKYDKFAGTSFQAGVGKKGKISGSVLVANELPEPLAEV